MMRSYARDWRNLTTGLFCMVSPPEDPLCILLSAHHSQGRYLCTTSSVQLQPLLISSLWSSPSSPICAQGRMGCSTSSQTSAVDTTRPSTKPEESNGASATGDAHSYTLMNVINMSEICGKCRYHTLYADRYLSLQAYLKYKNVLSVCD